MPTKSMLKKLTVILVPFLFTLILSWFGCGGGAPSNSPGPLANTVPSITTLSPPWVTAGAGAQTLTIDGAGFLSSSTVTYNSVAHAATHVSASELTIQLSASDEAAGGNYPVVVTNPAPGGGGSNFVNFTVENPVPAINSLTPGVAPSGTSSQNVTISGSNFLSSSIVSFNGSSHPFTYVSSTQLTLSLSTSDLASAGTDPVVVNNPSPGGGPSNTTNFSAFLPVTTQQATTNAQGQAVFSSAGITIQMEDLVTQQPLPGMNVNLLLQQGIANGVAISDPNAEYVPVLSALNSLPVIASDVTYSVNMTLKNLATINSGLVMPIAALNAIQDESPTSSCASVPGSQVPNLVLEDVGISPQEGFLVTIAEMAGEIEDPVGDVVGVFQTGDLTPASIQALIAAADFPTETFTVCKYSAGNPIIGYTLVSIQWPTTSSTSAFTASGIVQNSLGTPIPGATVTAIGENQQSVQTNASGNFTISNLSEGNYTLQAMKPGYVPSTTLVAMASGVNNIEITLPSTAAATSVQFSSGPPYTITINGKGFGSPQQPMPYSGDLGNFSVADESCYATTPGFCEEGYSGDAFTLNYQTWSDSQIVVGGYSQYGGSNVASPGDAVEIGIWNNSTQTGSAGFVWAGNLPPVPSDTPQISAVLFSGTGANLQITILGSGFGSTPPSGVASSTSGTPYLGLTSNLRIGDYAGRASQMSQSVVFRAGFVNPTNGAQDSVSVNYLSWSDSEIELGGFGGQYGTTPYTVQSGDPISIIVWSTANSLATGWGGYVP